MRERSRAQAGSDGVSWWCPTCKTTKSIRDGSFFSKSKLTLQKWMIAMLWWSREYPVTLMAEEAEIPENTACCIYQWLREVCSTALLPMPMGFGWSRELLCKLMSHNSSTNQKYGNPFIM